MSSYALKGRFQDLLRPCVRLLARVGVTANQVTLLAALVSLVVAFVVWRQAPLQPGFYLLLPAWMLLRMALNAVDGMLAREFGQASRLGAYLNELCDVVADAALYLALLSLAGVHVHLLWAMALLAALTEYAGVLGLMVGATRRYDGPMGKSDRAAAVGVATLLIGLGVPAGRWPDILMAALCGLLVLTIVNRARGALRGSAA